MAALAGLTGMSADSASQEMDQGVAEAHANVGGYDPSHSKPGDLSGESWPASGWAGYHGTSYGQEVDNNGQMGTDYRAYGVGIDQTPDTHESPYPEGLIQPNLEDPGSYARTSYDLAVQRKKLHGQNMGGVRKLNGFSPAGRQTPTNYTTDRYDSPDDTDLSTTVPGQIRGTGNAQRDVQQGYGKLNDNPEFQHGHSIRRVQHDGIAWDRSLAYPGRKPFYGRHPVMTGNSFDVDSVYGQVAGDTSTGQQVMEKRGFPTPYEPQPLPVVAPSSSEPSDDVWAW